MSIFLSLGVACGGKLNVKVADSTDSSTSTNTSTSSSKDPSGGVDSGSDKEIPSVDAGPDKVASAPTLQDGTVPDASSVTYEWSQDSGPGTLTFGTKTAEDTTITASVDGVYVVRLTAKDAAGNSASDTMTFTWDTLAPAAPMVSGTTPTTSTMPAWSWTSGGGGEWHLSLQAG